MVRMPNHQLTYKVSHGYRTNKLSPDSHPAKSDSLPCISRTIYPLLLYSSVVTKLISLTRLEFEALLQLFQSVSLSISFLASERHSELDSNFIM